VQLDTVTITPSGEGYIPYRGESVHAVKITITDRERYQPVWMSLVLLSEIKRMHPSQLTIERKGMTQMLGTEWAYDAVMRGEAPAVIWKRWENDVVAWNRLRAKYALYTDAK
jgi:uncharacterized protein YbbC (DUF1343 family)